MNNKKIGTEFEEEMCGILATLGYWVHFLAPDSRGAQPFDVLAVKDGEATAIDCKTSVSKTFPLTRLEDNQILSFDRWMKCGNSEPAVAVKHDNKIFRLPYLMLKEKKKIELTDDFLWFEKETE